MQQIKYPKLAKKLKELRKAYSYRQADVAAALDIGRQTYVNYETGIRTPSHETLFKLAGFYNIFADDLLQLSVDLDRDIYYDAPTPTQSSEDLAGFLEYFNNPANQKKFRLFSNSQKELIYYFDKLTDDDKQEIIEFTKIKAHKKRS